MAGPGLRKPEIDKLKLRLRQLRSLHTHGLGQIGPSREIWDCKNLIQEIEERLKKPPVDLDGKAEALIARFGNSQWVLDAIKEAEEKCAA